MLFGFFLSFAGAIALIAARIYIRNQYEQLKVREHPSHS